MKDLIERLNDYLAGTDRGDDQTAHITVGELRALLATIRAADAMLDYFPANRDAVTENYRDARAKLEGE